jgi:hypothetical protein
MFLPLNRINGGNFSPAAFVAIKTVMFSLPGPLIARWVTQYLSPQQPNSSGIQTKTSFI